MKSAWIAFGLLLAVSAAPSRADELFSQNPFECVFTAKASRMDDQTRRANLAHCMMKVSDITQALRALEAMNYQVDYTLQREIESKVRSGQLGHARAMLGDLITLRVQDPARVKELKDAAIMEQQQQRIVICLSHPERKSPARDQACKDVPGFRNSTGRINSGVAEAKYTGPTPAMIRDRYKRDIAQHQNRPAPAFCTDASIINPYLRAECP